VPLSLLYLAAVLEEKNITVSIYDALIDFDITKPLKNDQGQYHIGAAWDRIVEKVLESSPDIVGITNPFSDFASYAIKTAEVIKKADPSLITVVGGPHASGSPESFFTDTRAIDYVLRGEGEKSFPLLIEALENKAPPYSVLGITCRRGAEPYSNPGVSYIEDLDELPLPAYHCIDMERYVYFVKQGFPSRLAFAYPGSEREISLITSRGCPFQCCFCGNHLHMGRRWRRHSAEYVIRHITMLVQKYGIRHFHIEDDNLTLDVARFERLISAIIENRWDITWDTPNGIRADRLTPEIITGIRASGCTYLIVGIESGNQQVLDTIVKKKLTLEHIQRTATLCKKAHINLHGFYIIGFPGETAGTIRDTLRFAETMLVKWDVIPHVSLARPLPGTELFTICQDNGYLTDPIRPEIGGSMKAEVFPRIMIRTESFNPSSLERWMGVFNKRVVVIILAKTLFFCLLHPRILFREFSKLVFKRQKSLIVSLKELFFNRLLFKYCYDNPVVKKYLQK
jgi:radical SAM superfamily enzyme YgiQ (UPF0313 family)